MFRGRYAAGRLLVACVLAGLAGLAGCVKSAEPRSGGSTGPSRLPTALPASSEKRDAPLDMRLPSVAEFGPLPSGFSSWAELLGLQQRLSAAADRINAAAGTVDGLAGLVAQPESRQLTVYWKGAMPAATELLIAEIRTSLWVVVRPARFSAAEL